jgi:hypothetical protein
MNNAFQPMDESLRLKRIYDLQNILYKMDYYQRESGFIAEDILGNLTFFDSEPSFGGAFITRGDILDFIDIFNG